VKNKQSTPIALENAVGNTTLVKITRRPAGTHDPAEHEVEEKKEKEDVKSMTGGSGGVRLADHLFMRGH
jgi:hypothetical protein